jgi:hypothetical protein
MWTLHFLDMDAPLAVLGRRCFVNGCRSVYRVQKVSVPRACKLVVKGISPSFDEGDWKTCAPLRSSGRRVFCDHKRLRRVPHGRRRRSVWQSPRPKLNGTVGIGRAVRRRHHPRCNGRHLANAAMTEGGRRCGLAATTAISAARHTAKAVFFGRPERTSDVQRRTDIAVTNEAGRT